jgi:hypothetical protein
METYKKDSDELIAVLALAKKRGRQPWYCYEHEGIGQPGLLRQGKGVKAGLFNLD